MEEQGSIDLENYALSLLEGSILDGLKQWYKKAIDFGRGYVVFVVRRSYMLALIMERITGDKMHDLDEKFFLTDSSLFLRCDKLAEDYRRMRAFPPILLCDDVIRHGRNINHILLGLEERLCDLLCEDGENGYKREDIINSLVAAVQINVYMRLDEPLLLLGRYELKLHYYYKGDKAFWHRLSNSITRLILRADMANASYVYSEGLSADEFAPIESRLIKTVYQNITQYTSIEYVGKTDKKKAVLTIRIVDNGKGSSNRYRVIPFVFLPNLGAGETQLLLDKTKEKLSEKSKDWLERLYEIDGKRTFNEALSLIYSDVLLREFMKKINGLNENNTDIADDEIKKLVRNYNWSNFKGTEAVLRKVLNLVEFSKEKLVEILESSIPDDKYVVECSQGDEREISSEQKRKIRRRSEDYFYNKGKGEEISALELSKLPYFETAQRSVRDVRGCSFILRQLSEGYNEAEMDYFFAHFLQMMDAGILTLSSYAPNDMKVVGFAQFAKAGEQSLVVKPLRIYSYIQMLSKMQKECERLQKDIVQELLEYARTPRSGLTEDSVSKIKDFLKDIKEMEQKPQDWRGNFYMNLEQEEDVDQPLSLKELLQYYAVEEELLGNYEQYVKQKYYS